MKISNVKIRRIWEPAIFGKKFKILFPVFGSLKKGKNYRLEWKQFLKNDKQK